VRSRSGLDAAELRASLARGRAALQSLEAGSVLLTGATGWFGTWLLDLLCAANESLGLGLRIAAVSRAPGRFLARHPQFADAGIRWIECDVRELDTGAERFTHLIHGAADSTVPPDPAAQRRLFDTVIDGTRRVLEIARGCRAALFLSSGAIYGPPGRTRRFAERDAGGPDPVSPRGAYAEAKRGAEQLCALAAADGVPVRIARCFTFVGPHMPFDRHFAIGNFISDAVNGRPIRVKSDGLSTRSYLYMTDLVHALLSILEGGRDGRAYNVGSDIAVSIEELARCVDRVAGGRGVVIEGAASGADDHYVPDTARIVAELGFHIEVPLETAVARTAAWYRGRTGGSVPS
jgi:dTDP-glucose 4,6-dehydratase